MKEYRLLQEKSDNDKESIVNGLLSTFEQIGEEKFIMYEDGNVEYNYINDETNEFNAK